MFVGNDFAHGLFCGDWAVAAAPAQIRQTLTPQMIATFHDLEACVLERLFGGRGKIPSLNPREAWERLSGGQPAPVLIDVREPWEYNGGHAKGARNIPLSQLERRVNEIPRNRAVLLICQSGHRSMSAARLLQREGVPDVTNISGGTTVWRMHGLPLEGRNR